MKKLFLLSLILITLSYSYGQKVQKKILFDNTHAEQAGNADWVIDDGASQYPSPAQSGITSSTTETYWTGALSSWGVEMVKRGYWVETLPPSGEITYGDASNSQDLSNYNVFVVCEPNDPFSSSEEQAMINFVKNGGGLFIVADHGGADRNGNNWDANKVWNKFFLDYNNPFGVTFNDDNTGNIDPATNVAQLSSNEILHGAAGDVNGLAFYSGGTMTIDKSINSTVLGLVFMPDSSNTGSQNVMAACANYVSGRIVLVGDSSVPEDKTPNSGTTYDGWNQPTDAPATGDDGVFMTNASIWLANANSTDPIIFASPSILNFKASSTNPANIKSFSLSGNNLNGNSISISVSGSFDISIDNTKFSKNLNISYSSSSINKTIYVRQESNLPAGSYTGKITCTDNGSTSLSTAISLNGEVNNNSVILKEDFSSCPPSNWTIYSVAGSKDWECNSTDQSISINAYGGDAASDDWLISPKINLKSIVNGILTFDSWTQYTDAGITNPEVKIKYSTNYPGTGNPESYSWAELSYNYPAENSQTWTSSGNIDLSAIKSSNVYFAFHYTSSGTGKNSCSFWKIDNVIIEGEVKTNIKEKHANNILLYPNPVTNKQITISSDNQKQKHIVLINTNGQVLKTKNFSQQEEKIDLSNFKAGIYFMKIIIDNAITWEKIIIE